MPPWLFLDVPHSFWIMIAVRIYRYYFIAFNFEILKFPVSVSVGGIDTTVFIDVIKVFILFHVTVSVGGRDLVPVNLKEGNAGAAITKIIYGKESVAFPFVSGLAIFPVTVVVGRVVFFSVDDWGKKDEC